MVLPRSGPSEPGESPPVEHLKLDPYVGPRSHHASRAFAEMQARVRKRRRRAKMALIIGLLVLGGGLALAIGRMLAD